MVGTSGMVPARNKAFVGKEKKRKRKREKKMRHYHQGKLKNLIINFCTVVLRSQNIIYFR